MDSDNLIPFSLLGDADPAGPDLMVSQPQQGETLSLLYEVSHELTSILDRGELLRRIAERVKKLVDYDVFTVMLWNESKQVLESVFSMRFQDAIPSRFEMPLHQGITGTAAAERRTIRNGQADCGIATRAAARSAGLDFMPLVWEQFDLLMRQRSYFRPSLQALISFLREDRMRRHAAELTGYDMTNAGKVRFAA